jgi:hypothetical protein
MALNFCCFAQQQSDTGLTAKKPAGTFETQLKNSLISYYSKYPREKVFIHTNQGFYSSSETIWYKVYATAYGKPTALSKIIYVQLTDTAGNVIAQNKLLLSGGKAYGNIDIGQKIKSGWYSLSGFTSWMMNFDHQAYYRQRIYISNLTDSVIPFAEKASIKKVYHIAFYPEGGDLVDGNLTKIAFNAYSDDGLPAMVEGVIKDNTNKVIEKISTVHAGMGEFTIEAIAGSSYSATVQFPDGSKQEVKLPEVKTTGIYLQASQTLSTVQLKLAFAGLKEKSGDYVLAAFQNSGQVNTYPLQLLMGINEFELSNAGFSPGILRLTVFDHNGLPQAERILFINKHDLQTTSLKTDTLSFLPGGLNSFSAIVKDKTGQPVKGNYSVAVTDGDAFKDDASQNIFSALLLSPELKGEIYDPGYYFKNESDSLARQLDLVMLTNGWRHFSWQKILNNENYSFKYPVEQSPYIAGKVMGYENLILDKNNFKIKLLVMNQDSTKFIGYISPDSTGRFIIKDFNHTGRSDIYLQTADKINHIKNLQVKIFNNLDDSLRQVKADSFAGDTIPNLPGYYISHAQSEAKYNLLTSSIMLNTVNVKEKKASPTEKLIAEHVSAKYTSDREFTLDLVDNPTLNMSIIDYIRGRFPNLQVVGDAAHPGFIYRGGNTLGFTSVSSKGASNGTKSSRAASPGAGGGNGNLPYFYVDETPVQWDFVMDISLEEVALIRFMPPPVWFVPYNGGNVGAIMIYTKKQSDEIRVMTGLSDNFDHYIFNGFSITREFNAPDHVKLQQAGLMDDRITLYWNHDVETDNNGVLKFRFHNTDIAKKFRVIIQGMDAQGRLVYLQQTVQQNLQ